MKGMSEKLLEALAEHFIEDSPLYADVKGLMELAAKEEREWCAKVAEDYQTSENTNLPSRIAKEIREG